MRTTVNTSPFTHCQKGHDLHAEDAYIFLTGGMRACRVCTTEAKGKRPKVSEKSTIGSFDG
jgi:hypothetical protein